MRARVAARPHSLWLAALGLLGPLLFACTSNTSDSVASAVEYEACGLCFESSVRLTRLRGVAIDSCVFAFEGHGLEVKGAHADRLETAAPPQTRGSGRDFESVQLAQTSVRPIARLEVRFARVEQREIASHIVESLRRCGMPAHP